MQEITIPAGEAGADWQEPKELSVSDEDVSIAVGQDAQATIILEVQGTVSVQVELKQHAALTVICFQTTESTLSQVAHVAEGATMKWQNISLAPVKQEVASYLEGPHARSDIDWMFHAKNSERQTLSAQNVFESIGGTGEITMKGIAEDTAHIQCDGLIAIAEGGKGTDTYLTEDVLMLDATAKVNVVPGLEIKTNDVKASHSATVSKVTPEDLFYLASRGIDEATARAMYLRGFLGAVIARVEAAELQERIFEALTHRVSSPLSHHG